LKFVFNIARGMFQARSSDLLSVFKEVPMSEAQQTDAISAASGE
jgi:hypothetical protein